MRGWIGGAIGGVLAAAIVTLVWWIGTLPHPTPVYELRDLSASPLCLAANGAPRPHSPTIGATWQRVTGATIEGSRPVYHGDRSIELNVRYDGATTRIGFLRVEGRRWRPALDPDSTAWAAYACR